MAFFFRNPTLAWLAFERTLRWYLERLSLSALLQFQNNEGWWVTVEFGSLLAFLTWGPAWWIPLVCGYRILEILLVNSIIVFVTGQPIHPLRSVVLTIGAYANLGLAFAVFWIDYSCESTGAAQVLTAIYQSFRTLGTMGPQLELVRGVQDWKFQALVASELLAGIYFLGLVLATYVSWASRGPR